MIGLLWFALAILASPFKSKLRLEAENAVLRHQLIVLRRRPHGRVQLTNYDRWFFVQLYRWFPSILKVLMIVRPETLLRWHRAGFRCYWRWKSRRSTPFSGSGRQDKAGRSCPSMGSFELGPTAGSLRTLTYIPQRPLRAQNRTFGQRRFLTHSRDKLTPAAQLRHMLKAGLLSTFRRATLRDLGTEPGGP
jgi:hypothetical protein